MKVASLAVFLCVFVSIRSHNIVKRQEGGGGARSRKIADGVYAFTSNGQYVSMFIVDPEGVMVIEPVNVQHSQQMLEEVQKITQAPIKYLFYSHNHYDHAKGGQVWKDQGATIVSHVDAFDYIKAYPSKDLILPDMKWTGDFFTMTVGNQKLELHHYGLSHGSGMTAFILPKQRVAYIADNVTPNRVFFSSMPDYNIPGFQKTLGEYLKFDVDQIVTSHSGKKDPLDPGTLDDVRFTQQYLKDIQDAILSELQKGTNPFAIPSTLKLDQYKDVPGYDMWFRENVQAVLYDTLLGPLSWRPERQERSLGGNNPCTPPSSPRLTGQTPTSTSKLQPQLPTYSSNRGGRGRYNQNSFNQQINNFKSQTQNSFSESEWRPVRHSNRHN